MDFDDAHALECFSRGAVEPRSARECTLRCATDPLPELADDDGKDRHQQDRDDRELPVGHQRDEQRDESLGDLRDRFREQRDES